MILNSLKACFAPAVAAFLVLGGTAVPALAAPVKNIVLVHGAWVDASGWKPVYKILMAHETPCPPLFRQGAPNAQTHWKVSRVCRWHPSLSV
jgi:hypothetical protein